MKVHILIEVMHIFDNTSPERTLVNRITFIRGVFTDKAEAEAKKESMEMEAKANPMPAIMMRYSIEEHDVI